MVRSVVYQSFGAQNPSQASSADRYVGTLGSIANKPADSKFPHYETFPAAEKYDWVRAVTKSTINGISVLEGQEWICNTKTGKDLPSNWEIRGNSNFYDPIETIVLPAHGFAVGDVLRKSSTPPFWNLAYLTDLSLETFSIIPALENFGNILVVAATTDTFSIPKHKGLVKIPNHQLGDVGDLLFLDWSSSPSRRGKLTNYSHRAGDIRVLIASVYDQDTLDYKPSPSYEVVI